MFVYFILYLSVGFIISFFTRAKSVIQDSIDDTELSSINIWKARLFKLILYSGAVSLWPIFIKSFFEKEKQKGNELAELFKAVEELNTQGISTNKFIDGYGEFGLVKTNPIPCNTVFGSAIYLSRLRTDKGEIVTNTRIGSFKSDVSSQPIDGYKISHENGDEITIIYLSPYQKKNSTRAPSGFILINNN